MSGSHWPSLGQPYTPPPLSSSPRSFGYIVGGFVAIASAVSAWRGRPIRAEVLATLSAVFLLAALLRPSILGGASRVWGRVGHVLAWINSRILLTLLFFLVLTPLGFLARLFGSDPLGARVAAHWERFPERLQRPNHYEHWF